MHTVEVIQSSPVAKWSEEELARGQCDLGGAVDASSYELKFSKYNPTPGE